MTGPDALRTLTRTGWRAMMEGARVPREHVDVNAAFLHNLGYTGHPPKLELTFPQFLDAVCEVAAALFTASPPHAALRQFLSTYLLPLYNACGFRAGGGALVLTQHGPVPAAVAHEAGAVCVPLRVAESHGRGATTGVTAFSVTLAGSPSGSPRRPVGSPRR